MRNDIQYEGGFTESITIKIKNYMPGVCEYSAYIDYIHNGVQKTQYDITTEKKILFPTREIILQHVQSDFDRIWQETKQYATANKSTHIVQEYGAWVWFDAMTGTFYVDEKTDIEQKPIPLLGGTQMAEIYMEQPIDDRENARYVVANFHTHFPLCYAKLGPGETKWRDPCGPTEGVDNVRANTFRMPSFVYDYEGKISHMHPIDAKAKVYNSGTYTRREL